jgi:hypothetical protein
LSTDINDVVRGIPEVAPLLVEIGPIAPAAAIEIAASIVWTHREVTGGASASGNDAALVVALLDQVIPPFQAAARRSSWPSRSPSTA